MATPQRLLNHQSGPAQASHKYLPMIFDKTMRFEVELPLQDKSGKTIGAAGIVFNYKAGDNQAELQKKAEKVRDEIESIIGSKPR